MLQKFKYILKNIYIYISSVVQYKIATTCRGFNFTKGKVVADGRRWIMIIKNQCCCVASEANTQLEDTIETHML